MDYEQLFRDAKEYYYLLKEAYPRCEHMIDEMRYLVNHEPNNAYWKKTLEEQIIIQKQLCAMLAFYEKYIVMLERLI